MKNCEICLKEFQRLPNGHTRKYCFECSPSILNGKGSHKVAIRQAYKREAVRILGNKCHHCGVEGHQAIFDFHHIDPSKKEFSVSTDGYTRSLEKYLLEIRKCALLCKNCHALHHMGEIEIDFLDIDYSLVDERFQIIKENLEGRINRCECGTIIQQKANACSDCYHKSQRTVERPEALQLAKEIVETSFVAAGSKYGVSDNSIKKWCKTYKIPHLKKELEEWYYEQIGEPNPNKKEPRKNIDSTRVAVSMYYNNSLVKEFDTIEECAIYLAEKKNSTIERTKEGISRVLRGKRNSYLGYYFK